MAEKKLRQPKDIIIKGRALSEILRKHQEWIASKGQNGKQANLNKIDLRNANLREAYLCKAKLIRAILVSADLIRADLSWASLSRTDLSEADLVGANLQGAILVMADLRGANLSWASLNGADLSGADLSGTNFNKANLSKTNLSRANLSLAKFYWAKLSEADFRGSILCKVNNIEEAEGLESANFTDAKLGDDERRFLSKINKTVTQVGSVNIALQTLKTENTMQKYQTIIYQIGIIILVVVGFSLLSAGFHDYGSFTKFDPLKIGFGAGSLVGAFFLYQSMKKK